MIGLWTRLLAWASSSRWLILIVVAVLAVFGTLVGVLRGTRAELVTAGEDLARCKIQLEDRQQALNKLADVALENLTLAQAAEAERDREQAESLRRYESLRLETAARESERMEILTHDPDCEAFAAVVACDAIDRRLREQWPHSENPDRPGAGNGIPPGPE